MITGYGAPGSRIKDPVSFVDFAPTVLSLAGANIPAYMQGRAFAGLAKAAPNEFVFATRDRMDERYDMMRSIIDTRWLYIRNFRPDIPYVQSLEYMFKARGYQSWARLAASRRLTRETAQYWAPNHRRNSMIFAPIPITSSISPARRRTGPHWKQCACG